ncbi:MAG TPA: M28 family peptidase [Gemmatimonadales bacterium]
MPILRRAALALVVPALAACAGSSGAPATTAVPAATPTPGALPLKLDPRPTTAAITPADLMTRVYIFADDSMLGREAGTVGNVKGNAYIVRELERLGLEPAGENGTYLQTVPMVRHALPDQASLAVDGQPLSRGSDWLPVPALSAAFPFGGAFQGEAQVIYGGRAGDVASYPSPEQVRGRVVVLSARTTPDGQPTYNFWTQAELARFRGAAAVAVTTLELTPPQIAAYFAEPQTMLAAPAPEAGTPFGLVVSRAAAARLLGADPATLAPGAAGRTVSASLAYVNVPTDEPAQNVVAILPGSDPALRGQYVAIGAHNDHDGLAGTPVDHDSLRAFNTVMRPRGAEDSPGEPTPAERARIRAILDSLRAVNPVRMDSVYNGADDDGSGSMALLEIAENLAAMPTAPRRSTLFVWHTAEEKGLFGSEWYSEHPTVPRDSIVAGINIDMIGRAWPDDLPEAREGGNYVQLIGSRRLSTQLGELVESVNRDRGHAFRLDYSYDAEGHPDQYYCRSDHYNYARWGIPVVFFSTGGHRDYHQLTDEPQYLNYEHFARVTRLIRDVVVATADLPARPVVDGPKPDPYGACRQ